MQGRNLTGLDYSMHNRGETGPNVGVPGRSGDPVLPHSEIVDSTDLQMRITADNSGEKDEVCVRSDLHIDHTCLGAMFACPDLVRGVIAWVELSCVGFVFVDAYASGPEEPHLAGKGVDNGEELRFGALDVEELQVLDRRERGEGVMPEDGVFEVAPAESAEGERVDVIADSRFQMCEKKRKIVILRERVWCGLEEVELVHVGRYVKESLRNRVDFATSVARAGSEDQFHSGELVRHLLKVVAVLSWILMSDK